MSTAATARLAIVILSYKRKDLLAQCLRCVQGTVDLDRHQVVVVDNASGDGSAELVERDFPWATVLRNDENLGFAGGVNRGLTHVRADGYVLLNTDAVPPAGWVERLAEVAWSAPDVGAVCAMEVHADGTARWETPESRIRDPRQRPVVELDRLSFACALVRREVIDRIGYLDHRYFMYHEDWDYCHRARAAGFRLLFDPTLEVVHPGGASFNTQASRWRWQVRTASRLRYQLIHWPVRDNLRTAWKEAKLFGWMAKNGFGGAYLRGWLQTVRDAGDIRRRRRQPAAFVEAR